MNLFSLACQLRTLVSPPFFFLIFFFVRWGHWLGVGLGLGMKVALTRLNLPSQEFVCEKGIQFVRIDGSTLARDRRLAVENFRLSKEVEILTFSVSFL